MKKPSILFSDQEKKAISNSILASEHLTTGEIVPVVAAVSGRYDRAEDLFGLAFALVLLGLYWICFALPVPEWSIAPSHNPALWPVVLIIVLGFTVGVNLAARFPQLRLPFITKQEMQEEVERGALEAFQRFRLRTTTDATGVLIYVSLYEHRVRVVGDDAINAKLSDEDWQSVCDLVVKGFKHGRPEKALIEAIECAGQLLAKHFPVQPGEEQRGELANSLILLD